MKSEIKKYYLEEIINLNNKDAFNSVPLNDKINNLRDLSRKLFNWEGEIVFFPNPYYAKRTVFSNYQDLYDFYSNDKDEYLHRNLKITYIKSLENIKSHKALIEWKGSISEEIPDSFFLLQEIKDPSEISKYAKAFLYTPLKGITILGFKETLKPLYLGSKAVKELNKNDFELAQGPEILECGTGNYPLLLYLESCWNQKS